ncbi:MAG: hypothetical protein ACP5IB_02240 [Thermoplasmata archaeon]
MRISTATAYGILLFILLFLFEIKYNTKIIIDSSLNYLSTLGINIFSPKYFVVMIILAILILSSIVGAFYLAGRDDEI